MRSIIKKSLLHPLKCEWRKKDKGKKKHVVNSVNLMVSGLAVSWRLAQSQCVFSLPEAGGHL